MLQVEVGHGGSRRSSSGIVPYAHECLVKLDREQHIKEFRYCASNLKDNDNSPWFLLGTLFHSYQEYFFKHGNRDRIEFVDSICGGPGQDFQDEAWRLFQVALPHNEALGEYVAAEVEFDGDKMRELWGVDVTGRLDLIVRKPNGRLYIVDYKTTSRVGKGDFNKYHYRENFFQRVVYTWSAIGHGYPIEGFEFFAISKTKDPEVTLHTMDEIRLTEFEQVRKYLQFAEHRRKNYPREYLLNNCSDCAFNYDFSCTKGASENV